MNSLESNLTKLVSKETNSPSEEYFQMEEASEMSSNYMQTETAVKNDNSSNGVPFSGTIAVAPDSPPGLAIGAGITLMQSSPPPASYRHSRAYRHFKNPPQPHMCIRTTSESGEELFINVLSWTRIVIPQEPSDPIPLYGGMRVPPGSPRSPPIVFAVMANPEVLKDSGRHSKDAEERRAMVELMCDFVEAMNPGVKLVRNAVILKDRDISGELKDVWNAVQAQRDREREEQLLQQRQQQQYITTQQMFPKTGQHALPTPSPMLIGGRCGSLVGSGNEITSTEAHQNATSEENSATSSNYETSAGEESETTHFVTTTSALSAITDACPDTSTATGTSDHVSATAITTTAATTTTTTISTTNNDDDECASLSNQMNTIEYEKEKQVKLEEEQQKEEVKEEENVKQKTTTTSATTTTMTNVEWGKDHVDSVTNQQNSKYKNNNINLNNNKNNNNNNSNSTNNNNNINNSNNDNNKNKLNHKSNNQLLPTMANNLNENILKFCNKTAKCTQQQQQQQQQQEINTTTTTTTLLPTTKLQQMEDIDKTPTTTTTIGIATTKTTENTAINALSNNNPTTTTATTTTTAILSSKAAATTTTTPTTTTTLLTKREKLGGFLPNGCIFPRFKNNKKDKEKDKDKDKDKEREKETKCKDKEKTLLYALKKSKDKKMANLNVDKKCQANKQDKVSTSAQQQQQQQQQLVDTNAQYDKNCINLENEMQKLELNNKINETTTTNNSEKNMFNKLKCATSSATSAAK